MNNTLQLGNDQFAAALRAFLPLSDVELAQMHHHAELLDSILANLPETGYKGIPATREVLALLMATAVGVQRAKEAGLTLVEDDSGGAAIALDRRPGDGDGGL